MSTNQLLQMELSSAILDIVADETSESATIMALCKSQEWRAIMTETTTRTDPKDSIDIAIAYHSGSGHTARQAAAVARGAASVPGVTVALHDVSALTDDLWAALDRADAIIFGAPTYMGGPSAVFKAFAEGTARAWADNLAWKDKFAA